VTIRDKSKRRRARASADDTGLRGHRIALAAGVAVVVWLAALGAIGLVGRILAWATGP
jgi:hypothetical protein